MSVAVEFFTVRQLKRWAEQGLFLTVSPDAKSVDDFTHVTLKEAQAARAVEMLLPFSSFDLELNNASNRQDIIRKLLEGRSVHVGDLTIRMRTQA